MRTITPKFQGLLLRLGAVAAAATAIAVLAGGCDTGGKEGDRCNPLVLQDECDDGLKCKAASCTESYCCPTNRVSADPHCNTQGCVDTDAGDDGGSDAAQLVNDGGVDAAVDAPVDSESDAMGIDASDGGDEG